MLTAHAHSMDGTKGIQWTWQQAVEPPGNKLPARCILVSVGE